MELKETERKLYKMADRTVDKMKKHIKDAGKYNTGNLYRSVRWKVIESGIEFQVKAPYATFVLKGRRQNAKMPPSTAILKWIKTPHGRRALANIRRRWPKTSERGAAFLIARGIQRRGIRKVDFFNPYIDQLYNTDAWHELEAAFMEDIENDIEKQFK